MRRQYN